jgi:TolB-like protein
MQSRRLAAILFTDIVGYTSMMQKDEQTAVSITQRYMGVLKKLVAEHGGEVLNDYGDGSLCSFPSATDAMRCAMQIQQQLQSEPKVPLRIGLHVGEIFFEDGKVFGDGVNVASRIQSLGVANSILFSAEINSKLKNQSEFKSVPVGNFQFKNVDERHEVFAIANEGFAVPVKNKMEGKLAKKNPPGKVVIIISSLLLFAIAFFVFRMYTNKSGFTGKEKSIAVLPFETISADKANEYINDGFTIDIINKLSKLTVLKSVPGWARVKIFKNTTKALADIANELGVAAILTGTIQKQNDQLHVVAELTDMNTGKTIWNRDYDRKWGDVLTLQNEVAENIATSLAGQLSSEEKTGINKQSTQNTEAYNYYIRGRYFWDNRSPVSFDSAETNYKKAISLDPQYGLAYAGLADLFIFNQKGLTQLEAMPIARDYATQALRFDSTLVEAITTIGFIQSVYDYDWKKSKLTLEKAIKLNPNYAYAHIYYGNLLQYTGESTERGIEEIKKARNLDPLSASLNWVLGRNYYFAGNYDLAEEQLRKTININSKFPLAKSTLAMLLLDKRRYTEAFEFIKQLPVNGLSTNEVYRDVVLSYAYAVSGNLSQARFTLEKSIKEKTYKYHYLLAKVYVALNEFDRAFEEMNKGIQDRELTVYFTKVDPAFTPLKNDPRFNALLNKLNLN